MHHIDPLGIRDAVGRDLARVAGHQEPFPHPPLWSTLPDIVFRHPLAPASTVPARCIICGKPQ